MAEGIELEPVTQETSSMEVPPELCPSGTHEQLYAEAKALAEERLAPSHPVASLARRFGGECAVCAHPGKEPRVVTLPPLQEEANRGTRLADGRQRNWTGVARATSSCPIGRGGASTGNLLALPTEADESEQPPLEGVHSADLGSKRSNCGRSRSASKLSTTSRRPGGRGIDRQDVFSDFLQSAKARREARLGASHENLQEDNKKRLHQVHRLTRLLLEQSEDDELKSKRYSKTGHEVFMKNLVRENRSRSDPVLVGEAKRSAESPEILQVRRLNRLLFVKPPTPEAVPIKRQPLVQEELAGQISGLFKTQTPQAVSPEF